MNITDSIRIHSARQPQAIAIVRANGLRMSYRRLDEAIDRLAVRLLRHGLVPGQTVALDIASPADSLPFMTALALGRIGVASTPSHLPPHRLAAVLGEFGTPAPSGVPLISMDETWLLDEAADRTTFTVAQDADAVFRVLATSGTTGQPRFCSVTHAAMAARTTVPGTNAPQAGTQLCASGVGSAWGLRTALQVLAMGGTLVFAKPAELAEALVRFDVTSLTASTAALQALLLRLPANASRPPALREIIAGGSLVPDRLRQLAAERLCDNVRVCYGASETGTIAMGSPQLLQSVPGSVGKVEPGVTVQVVDADDRPLPPGTEGVLRCRAPGMVHGYLDDAAATRECFRDGWFYPGDLGIVTTDDIIIVTGRRNEVINAGGVKVSPQVIEDVLLALPDISQAAAFGAPNAQGVTVIWAAVVGDRLLDLRGLQRLARTRLGERTPQIFIQVSDLPRNANGKVVTEQLLQQAARLRDRQHDER